MPRGPCGEKRSANLVGRRDAEFALMLMHQAREDLWRGALLVN